MVIRVNVKRILPLPPAARNLFEKRFLDFQKLLIEEIVGNLGAPISATKDGTKDLLRLGLPAPPDTPKNF